MICIYECGFNQAMSTRQRDDSSVWGFENFCFRTLAGGIAMVGVFTTQKHVIVC